MKMRVVAFLVFVLGILFSCSQPKQYIFENFKDEKSDAFVKAETITLIGENSVDVQDFQRAFESRFGKQKIFNRFVLKLYKENLETELFKKVKLDTIISRKPFKLRSDDNEKMVKINQILDSLDTDLLVVVTDYFITHDMNYFMKDNNLSGPGGWSTSATATGRESCIVKFQVQIWSKKDKKKWIDFDVIGESVVEYWMFELALEEAIEQAVDHATEFLMTGETDYTL